MGSKRCSLERLGRSLNLDFPPNEVIDLIPAKPLADEKPQIRTAYKQRLTALYQRLKP